MGWKHTEKKLPYISRQALIIVFIIIVLFLILGAPVHASGLVDDTVNTNNEYSKYPLANYQLDFYVDNSWDWLPWNWMDGIGKSVLYGLYCITNFIWTIILYLSNATGYVLQEAYKLNFINDMADTIGKSIQTLAGITTEGFSNSGFYVGFLLLFILILGIYVVYTGLIKRETSKALHSVVNFVMIFILSSAFIAYAPDYIKNVNDFSTDISQAALSLGTDIILSENSDKEKDSVNLIRDNLFSIQVKQPWLLLQFGTTNIKQLGEKRVEKLLSTSPSADNGGIREKIVKGEIEDKENSYLTLPQIITRLGMVFFLLIFDIGISIFVFLLSSMLIFSQVLFIIFAMFLPVSFLLSMIPSYEGMAKQAIVKLFNTIMTRAGITLIVTVAFSISSMFYSMSEKYPFFMVAFLQIVTFAGIYFKLGDIMNMFHLNDGNSLNIIERSIHKHYRSVHNLSRFFGKQSRWAKPERSTADNMNNASEDSGTSTGSTSNESKYTSAKHQRNNTYSPNPESILTTKNNENHMTNKPKQAKGKPAQTKPKEQSKKQNTADSTLDAILEQQRMMFGDMNNITSYQETNDLKQQTESDNMNTQTKQGAKKRKRPTVSKQTPQIKKENKKLNQSASDKLNSSSHQRPLINQPTATKRKSESEKTKQAIDSAVVKKIPNAHYSTTDNDSIEYSNVLCEERTNTILQNKKHGNNSELAVKTPQEKPTQSPQKLKTNLQSKEGGKGENEDKAHTNY